MKKLKFPKYFDFAIADADLQVIGEQYTLAEEGSCPTMWKSFAEDSGKCYKDQSPDPGVDRFHKWEQDLELIEELGVKSYRTSISMSRTLKSDGTKNQKAIDWYKRYFEALRNAGITVYATLYHWELPQYLNEKGGWTNYESVERFVDHAKLVAQELDDLIEEYFILNEPWCSSILSYKIGAHAPGHTDLKEALQASHYLLLAQGQAFREIKEISPNAKISTVFNVEPAYAATTAEKDVLAAKYYSGSFNEWFLDPIYLGQYPDYMLELYGEAAPDTSPKDMETIKIGDKVNTLGLNYYLGRIVKYDEKSFNKAQTVERKNQRTNDLGWPIFVPPVYPEGLYDVLNKINNRYSNYGLKQIYITENGLALETPKNKQNNKVEDPRRIRYYTDHFIQMHKAIRSGVPLKKFFLWTLMDNYEWAEGYSPNSCFGIIHVDRDSLERTWKSSAYWYKDIVQTNEIPVETADNR